MEKDKELEKLKQKKLNEMISRIEKQQSQENPKSILKSKLIDRGEEVLEIAERSYPNETKVIINKLAELIKQGKIQNAITGGELLSLFRNSGFNISVSTSISVSKDGKTTSLSDKLKSKE
jgi:DNA-binding TFAR19-related protein (PDSD5 family)